MTTPIVDPAYQAARNGFPGDSTAVNRAAQIGQFLASHGVKPVYQGNRVWTVAAAGSTTPTDFYWLNQAAIAGGAPGWLPEYDVDQPFIAPSGMTAIGRVAVAVQAAGNGADLQVTLYPDNGSGDPNLASPLASTVIPASHITQLSAAGSLASAGPLQASRYNTCYLGPGTSTPWTQPAVSLNGAGDYATPVTSGNWTVFIGGYDPTATAAVATVAAAQYLGAGSLSGAVSMPSLPQAAWYVLTAATADTLIAAGGTTTAGAVTNTWTASWDPSTGTVGSWSAQQALPAKNVSGAMTAWTDASGNEYAYVIGGSTSVTADATASVWQASVSNGQITAWTAGPPLPQPLIFPYAAVVGDWLIVAGGQNTSGTVQAATWYAQIGSGGVPGPWQAGPALPQAVFANGPGWNLAVTDSAMIIVSGVAPGSIASTAAQALAVSPDGPAPAWQLQDAGLGVFGGYQVAAYPSGFPGQWEAFGFQAASYASATLYPVPLVSVPLPVTGLTPTDTYHLVFHQASGDALNNYLQLGEMSSATPPGPWLYSTAGSGGPWSSHASHAVAVDIYDQTPGGPPWHLWQDSGARITTLVNGSASGLLLGVAETAALPRPALNANPYFAGGSGTGWTAHNGTFTVTSSPPAGAPGPYAGEYVNNGSGSGVMEESAGQFAVSPGFQYQVTAWVWSSTGNVETGFNWTDSGTYVSTSSASVTVPASTWVQVTTTQAAPSSGVNEGYPIAGTPDADSGTTYAYGVVVTAPGTAAGQIAAVTQVTYNSAGQPSGTVQLA